MKLKKKIDWKEIKEENKKQSIIPMSNALWWELRDEGYSKNPSSFSL